MARDTISTALISEACSILGIEEEEKPEQLPHPKTRVKRPRRNANGKRRDNLAPDEETCERERKAVLESLAAGDTLTSH